MRVSQAKDINTKIGDTKREREGNWERETERQTEREREGGWEREKEKESETEREREKELKKGEIATHREKDSKKTKISENEWCALCNIQNNSDVEETET